MTAVAAMEQLLDFQPTVSAFFEADGPKKLIFTYQPRGGARPALREVDDGNAEVPKPPSPPCVLTLSTDARTSEGLTGASAYFVRVCARAVSLARVARTCADPPRAVSLGAIPWRRARVARGRARGDQCGETGHCLVPRFSADSATRAGSTEARRARARARNERWSAAWSDA